ncbi:MAG: hypothetical protein HW375_37 [Anaerolineales bacterium]|nr:hypothetical protein [Anaerolineales bacterium]
MQPTKIPPRRVICDDFTVTVDGVEYHPHAGEWVEFLGVASMSSYLRLMRLTAVQGLTPAEMAALPSADARALVEDMESAIRTNLVDVARAISGWTWTDTSGVPFESPPSPDTLVGLSPEELHYLTRTYRGDRSGTARKNGSAPSTSRSTKRKAARSQKHG